MQKMVEKTLMNPITIVALIVGLISMLGFSACSTTLELDQNVVSTYIIHLKTPEITTLKEVTLDSWYRSFLPPSILSLNDNNERMVHSYRNVATGFAAKLTVAEAEALKLTKGVASVHPEKILSLQTTHTPNFLGLNQQLGLWKRSNFGKGMIIGILDTGLALPNHPSFSDKGLPPPPAKWRGSCRFSRDLCNNKIIGAKNFVRDGETAPFTNIGHGTHTASIVAGNFVENANAFGQANGTAAGMAPHAHLAIYRVCSTQGCAESDILAAMDEAVADGVDVLSLSIGRPSSGTFTVPISIGAFGAIQKGIFVSCSAGNNGPDSNSMFSEAPWILTVGASTMDRTIKATVHLGNGAKYDGESLLQPKSFSSSSLPIIYPGTNRNSSVAQCLPESLRNSNVKGKIVLCEMGGSDTRVEKGQEVKAAGGVGMILMNTNLLAYTTFADDAHFLPAAHVSYAIGLRIKAYINSTSKSTATIFFRGTINKDLTAPTIASFSSRGPSIASPGILKPDIVGPGVSILAAWPFDLQNYTRPKVNFNILTGTSMSTPHLSGIAALIKNVHHDWSPHAIKSAIMTTAYNLNLQGKPLIDAATGLTATIFATGAGHVDASKAVDPGLVYDITPDDYIPYFCGLGYSDSDIELIMQKKVKCSEIKSILEAQLNYPSFSIVFGSSSQTYTRTVTNVGPAKSTYKYKVVAPDGVDITVSPTTITFSETNKTATYTVTFSKNAKKSNDEVTSQGSLTWVSELHSVRSVIAVVFT